MSLRHLIYLALLLSLFWLMLSGHYTMLLLTFGALSVALCVLIAQRMDVVDHEGVPVHLTRRAPRFWLWLALEVVKSNIDVVRCVLDPRLPISRTLARIPTGDIGPLLQTVYANAITLTPGTVTVDIDDDEILVHALTRDAAQALADGEMGRRVMTIGEG